MDEQLCLSIFRPDESKVLRCLLQKGGGGEEEMEFASFEASSANFHPLWWIFGGGVFEKSVFLRKKEFWALWTPFSDENLFL